MSELELTQDTAFAQVFQRAATKAPSAEVWITFSAYQGSRPTGDGFVRSRGGSAIHVVSKTGDWYQHAEMGDLIELIGQIAGQLGHRRILLGGSMGGFAVLAFARSLNADLVICGSPQVLIQHSNPSDLRWDREWRDIARSVGLNRSDASLLFDPFIPTKIIIDSHVREDLWHLNYLRSRYSPEIINFPGAGHEAFHALLSLGLWARFMTALVEDDKREVTRVQALFKRRRKGSFDYLYALASQAMKSGRPRVAAELFRRSVRLRGDMAEPHFHLSVALEACGQVMEAEAAAVETLRISNTSGPRERLAHVRLLRGDLIGAEAVLREGIELDPRALSLRVRLTEMLLKRAGADRAEARQQLNTIQELDPSNARLGEFLDQLADYPDAAGRRSRGEGSDSRGPARRVQPYRSLLSDVLAIDRNAVGGGGIVISPRLTIRAIEPGEASYVLRRGTHTEQDYASWIFPTDLLTKKTLLTVVLSGLKDEETGEGAIAHAGFERVSVAGRERLRLVPGRQTVFGLPVVVRTPAALDLLFEAENSAALERVRVSVNSYQPDLEVKASDGQFVLRAELPPERIGAELLEVTLLDSRSPDKSEGALFLDTVVLTMDVPR